jgi:hypothetical protein
MSPSTRDNGNNEFNSIIRNFTSKTVISPIVKLRIQYAFNLSKPQHNPLSKDKKLPDNPLMIIWWEPD